MTRNSAAIGRGEELADQIERIGLRNAETFAARGGGSDWIRNAHHCLAVAALLRARQPQQAKD